MSIKDFRKQERRILDRRDRFDARWKSLDILEERFLDRPTEVMRRKIEKLKAELEKEEESIDDAEDALFAHCSLRPEFLPDESAGRER